MRRPAVLALLLLAAACGGGSAPAPDTSPTDVVPSPTATPPDAAELDLESDAFGEGDAIPVEHTCDGASTPPPLSWSGVPEAAEELAILMEDPDAPGGTYVHWTMWGLDPGLEGLDPDSIPAEAIEGLNSSDVVGYVGPCPPSGRHRYVFSLFALADRVPLEEGAPIEGFEAAVAKVAIAQAQLTGVYER